jgi:N-hydroxyarylamine O-acetyltransferase
VFDLQAHALSEYQDTCRYHETSPESHFTQGDVCTLLTATGRITLSGNRWIESTGNERHERGVGPTEAAQLLADRFGIRVDSET